MIKRLLSLVGTALLFFWFGVASSYATQPDGVTTVRVLVSIFLGLGFLVLSWANVIGE